MPTARNNLTNDAWTLIGSGAFDLQREDSRETILLYFGSSSPAIDSVHHARIVDNQVYSYRGTNNVYARSLDTQAFLVSTPITVSSAGDASAANQVTQSTKLDSIITNLATLISNIGTGLAKSAKQSLSFITSKVVTIGATSDFSGTVNASTTRVVLSSDIKCWVTIGTGSPTAVVGAVGNFYLPANQLYGPIDVTGGTTKIAVIGVDATAGKLSIFESS